MALVQGDLGEQRDVELSIIIQGHRLSWVALGDPGQTWAMQQASDGSPRVVFEQQGAADPRIRIFDPRTLRISPPYLRSALLQAQTRRPSTETQPPRPRLAQRLVPVSPELVDASAGLRSPGRRVPNRATSGTAGVQADIIVLNGATQGVQSAVAAGHQSVAPQEVNLQ